MKRVGLLLSLVLFPVLASAGVNAASAKSPQHYYKLECVWDAANATTTSFLATRIAGVLPQAKMVLKDVVLSQNTAGTGGTSWTVTPKRSGTALVTTPGGFTQAAGAGKTTNVLKSPIQQLTNPTGGTRPVLQKNLNATATVTVGADLAADDVLYITTTTGEGRVYTAKASGAAGWEFNIGADENADAASLAALINSDPASPVAASAADAVVTLTAKQPGTKGNSIVLGQVGDGYTISGNTSGGLDADSSGGSIITCDVTTAGTYTVAPTGSATLYFEPSN